MHSIMGDQHNPPINPEDVPVMDTGDLAPLFDNDEE
jgi:hypothetical protein